MTTREIFETALLSTDPEEGLEDLQQSGIIRQVFPVVQALVGFGGQSEGHKDLWGHTKRVVAQTVRQAPLRWASLFHDVGKPKRFTRADNGEVSFHGHELASARLFRAAAVTTGFWTTSEINRIAFAIEYLGHVESYLPEWTDSAVRRLGQTLGDNFEDVFALARADCTTKYPAKRARHMANTRELYVRLEAIKKADAIPPALPKGLGTAIGQHLGLPPDRRIGVLMQNLKMRVEAGDLPRGADIQVYLEALDLKVLES